MTHPLVRVETLSKDAQLLYDRHCTPDSASLHLDRDWFAPNAARLSQYARGARHLDPDYTPSDRLMRATEELVDAGFATWNYGKTQIYLIRYDPRIYTIARGNGPWDVRISRTENLRQQGSEGVLLAVLEGASLETRRETSELEIVARVPNARDEEHDPAFAARITLQLPTFPELYGRRITYRGVAGSAYLYPFGSEPTLLDAHDARIELAEPVWCTDTHCQDTDDDGNSLEHLLAPYQPPQTGLGRSLVIVEATMRQSEGAAA